MSLKPLLVSTINALKRDSQDKMKSILKADWIKSDKEKLVISIDKNVYNITFKKTGITIKNQNKAGNFSFQHIDKTKEQILVNLWNQIQAYSYSAAKIHNMTEDEFKKITLKPEQQELV